MREAAVRKSPLRAGLLGIAIALIWVAASAGIQPAGAQAQAQSAAAQAAAQASSPAAADTSAPQAGAPAAAPTAPPPPASAAGRRDPFRPLVVRGRSDELPARLPPGKAGLVIGQLTIQGIVRGLNGQWIAVVDNKTRRAYFLYAGDELYNGRVSRITENSVVFQERFMDQAGRQQTREVVKQLLPN
jgi:hypothetical protein